MRYKNTRVVAVAIGLALSTAACTNNKSMVFDYGAEGASDIQKIAPDAGLNALESAPVCCSSLSELEYQPISHPGKFDYVLSPESKAFTFSTGKSFVQGLELPKSLGPIKIAVSSPIISSVFVPTILVLNTQYQPMQIYGEETMRYDNASLLNGDRYYGEIELAENSSDARYLIILTTDQAVQGETELESLGSDAIAAGHSRDAKRIYQDAPVPHSAVGAVRLAFEYQPANTLAAKELVGKGWATKDLKAQQAPEMISQPQGAATVMVPEAPSDMNTALMEEAFVKEAIQPETEEMFIQLIKQAVRKGKLDKAMGIVKDAERAGSKKARDAFISTLQKMQ